MINHTVTDCKSDSHKRVVSITGSIATLEWWDESGRQEISVPVSKIVQVSTEPTPEFIQAKNSWVANQKRFEKEGKIADRRYNNPPRTNRMRGW